MKTTLAALVLGAALACVRPADAQVFGQYTGATLVPVNGQMFGAYFNASDHVIGGLAQLRLSFYPNIDFGFQGGLTRFKPGGPVSTRTTLRVGGDVRWHIAALAPNDMAVGAALGIETGDNFKVISVGPTVVASRTMGGAEGRTLVPYAGLGILFSSRDAFGVEDSDISVPLRMGLEGRLNPGLRVIAELQLFVADRYNDDVGFSAGVNLPF
ncbi:MAG TPA: hypothetical protein VJY35_09680 [Candidatus Eisenbacteria bacterium]|nr:hypothetical protein [Candidatus Eisenbacteria bacterium]